jgi:hypothetical protein
MEFNNGIDSRDPSTGEDAPLLSGQDPQQTQHQQTHSQSQSQQEPSQHHAPPTPIDTSYGTAATSNQQDAMAAYAMAVAQFEASNGDYAAYMQSMNNMGNNMNQMMPNNPNAPMPYNPYFAAPYGYGVPPPQSQGPGGGGMPAPYYGGQLQQHQQQQQPYYYNVPPPNTNGGPPAHPVPHAAAPSRPPRSARRSSGNNKLSPSLASSNTRKSYEAAPPPPSEPPPPSSSSESLNNNNNSSNNNTSRPGSGIPSLGAIFSNLSGGDGQPLWNNKHSSHDSGSASSNGGNGGTNGAHYGATTHTATPNKIWNAPLPPPGGRPSSSVHRRSSSDAPLRSNHRRVGSTGSSHAHNNSNGGNNNNYWDLPPMTKPSGGPLGVVARRSRSFSAGGGGGTMNMRGGGHRRSDSATSLMSNASGVGSVVSNIAKSALFGGVNAETGRVQLHFPYENIRLITTTGGNDDFMRSPDLEAGHLYLQGGDPDDDPFHHVAFEDYHRTTTDMAQGLTPHWESMEKEAMVVGGGFCTCPCNNCNGCTGKRQLQLLPTPQYVLAIEEDVYKRVLSEIAEAQTMPLGLFFCGHHEDVAYPSIVIAIIVVSILFVCMATIAYYAGMTS